MAGPRAQSGVAGRLKGEPDEHEPFFPELPAMLETRTVFTGIGLIVKGLPVRPPRFAGPKGRQHAVWA